MAPPLDLKDLRNLSKRDPSGYHAEFLLQYRHFQTQLQIFLLKPSEDYKPFSELVEYLCHVSDIYTKDMPNFPEQISNLLEKNSDILAPQLRKALVSSLILLRSKNQVTPHSVLSLFFKLFRCHDAGLREMLYHHIVSDITNINKKHKNQSLNTALQNFMFDMMQDPVEIAAKQSLAVMIELYRKRVWNDPKTVNVIATGCFSKFTSVVVSTLKFFLTVAEDDEEDKIAANKEKASEIIKRMTLKKNVKKMNRGREAKIDLAIAEAHAMRVPHRKLDPNWPAIELINDPQGYAEKVFGVVRHSFERIEVRLMMMNFISRLITTHKLLLLNFYPFVQKYLMPKNEHVTYALAILAQCIHELIPPTDLQPIVKHLVDKFVHDRSSTESIVAGLHTLREMCNRNPLIVNDTLVRDLAQYKNYKDRAVMAAARGIIGVFREKNPALLEKKDRGKEAVMSMAAGAKPLEYGQTKVASGVDDIELLDLVEKLEQQQKEQSTTKKKKVDEFDLEGNVISYDDEEEEEGEEDESMEDGEEEEMDGEEDEEEEIDEEEEKLIAIEKAVQKKGSKGGVIATEGVMSIAEALKLEQMQKKLIERQLENSQRRKRGLEQILSSDEEEEEEEDEEEEDEDEVEEEAAEQDQAGEPQEEEIDIWQRIALISEGIVPDAPAAKTEPAAKTAPAANGASKTAPAANGTAKTGPAANGTNRAANGAAKTEAAKSARPSKSGPPAKKARLELEEVEEESDEEDLEEIESGDEDMWEEASEEEGEGEWVDASEEEEEEEKANGKAEKKAAGKEAASKESEEVKEKEMEEAPKKVDVHVSSEKKSDSVRILSEEDFEKLNRLKQMKAEGKISMRRLKELAKNLEEAGSSDEEDDGTGFVDPSDLTKGIKAPRKRGEERMAEILEKRKESKENSRHKEKTKWTTNEEKSKHKNLMMLVKGKMYQKGKLSMREQQIKKQAGIKRFKTRRHK